MVVSCGGGTTTAKGDYSARIKLEFEQFSQGKDGSTARFQVGSTLVNSVVLDYGYGSHLDSMEVAQYVQNGGEVTIDRLEPGEDYTFSVAAYGPSGDMVCLGGDTARIVKGETVEVNLVCTFKDKYAVQNKVFDIAAKSMNGTLTSDEANTFVAGSFGLKDGQDRTAFIADMMTPDDSPFPYSTVTLARVELIQRDRAATGKSAVDPDNTLAPSSSYLVKFIYSDGTVEFDDLNFIIEGSEWKLAGNGLKYGMKARHKVVEFLSENNPGVYYGIEPYSNNGDNITANTMTVFGTGIEDISFTAVTNPDSGDISFQRDTPYDTVHTLPDDVNYSLVNYTANVTDGTQVNFDISENSVVTHETYKIRGAYDSGIDKYSEKPVIDLFSSFNKFSFFVHLPSWAVRAEFRYNIDGYNSIEQASKVAEGEGWLSLNNPSLIIDRTQYDGTEFMGGAFIFRYFDSSDNVYEVFIPYEYFVATAEYGELPDNTYPTMGKGFGMSLVQSADNTTYPLSLTNTYSFPTYTGIAMTAFTTNTTTDNVNYNPIVMKALVTPKGQTVKGTLIRIPKYDKKLYNVKIFWMSGGDLVVGAGIKDTGKVVFMRLSSDLSTVKWINTYLKDTDDASSGEFVDMIFMNGSSQLIAVMKGVKDGNQRTNLIKVSTTDGQVLSATTVESSTTGRYFAPVDVKMIKTKSRLLLLVSRTLATGKSTAKIVALDNDFNIIGGSAVIINRKVTDLQMDMDDQYEQLFLSYTEELDAGGNRACVDKVNHNLNTDQSALTFSSIDHNEIVRLLDAYPLTITKTFMQISGTKLYYYFSGELAAGVTEYINSVMAFDIPGFGINWTRNFTMTSFDNGGPGANSSFYGRYFNVVVNLSASGDAYGVMNENLDDDFGAQPSVITPDVSTDMVATPFVPAVNVSADDIVYDPLTPLKVKTTMLIQSY